MVHNFVKNDFVPACGQRHFPASITKKDVEADNMAFPDWLTFEVRKYFIKNNDYITALTAHRTHLFHKDTKVHKVEVVNSRDNSLDADKKLRIHHYPDGLPYSLDCARAWVQFAFSYAMPVEN